MKPGAPSHCVLLVPSPSYAIKGEAALARAGVPCALIPVPRTLSSQCGVCLRVLLGDRERAAQALEAAAVPVSAVHDLNSRLPGKEAADGHWGSER